MCLENVKKVQLLPARCRELRKAAERDFHDVLHRSTVVCPRILHHTKLSYNIRYYTTLYLCVQCAARPVDPRSRVVQDMR